MKTWRPGEDHEFDSTIDGEWRKASHEEPGPHVDAAILAAARTRRPRFVTWQPLAAAAAVAGLSFLLVQLLPSGRELEEPIRIESRQPATEPAEQPGATAKATIQRATEAAPVAPRTRENEARERQQPAPMSVVAPPHETAAAADGAAARAESSAPGYPAREMPPAQWATLIETLHASGDRAAAAAQLRAFRIAHPDADRYLPEELRAWASTIE